VEADISGGIWVARARFAGHLETQPRLNKMKGRSLADQRSADCRSQVAISSNIAPVTTKLSARIHAKPATTSAVGPNNVIISDEIESPISSMTARKKSIAADANVHILTDPEE